MSRTNQRSSERFKFGICLNDECPKCKEKAVQQIPMRKDFVCEECGRELRECPPPKKFNKTPIIIAAVAVVLLGGGAGAYFGLRGGNDTPEVAPIDTPAVEQTVATPEVETTPLSLVINQGMFDMTVGGAETVVATCEPADAEVTLTYVSDDEKVAMVSQTGEIHAIAAGETIITITAQTKDGETATARANVNVKKAAAATKASNGASLGWGNYSGPMQGGKPHGAGGTIRVSSSYSIDLKDGKGGTLQVYPGETIENTKFENGRLRSGELHRKDGTRKWFNC